MSLKGMVLCMCAALSLSSCFDEKQTQTPTPTPDQNTLESNINVDSDITAPLENNALVTFDLSDDISLTGDVDPLYTWYFEGIDSTPVTTSTAQNTFQYASNGSYQVTVIVSDNNNNASDVTINLVVVISSFDDSVNFEINAPTAISINETDDGIAVFDLESDITTSSNVSPLYTWSFGDDQTITSDVPYITHKYNDNGIYNAQVLISDENGNAQSVSIALTVTVNVAEMIAPNINITSAMISTTQTDGLVVFNVEGITTTGKVSPLFTWNFDDGSTQATTSESIEHLYNQNGAYNVYLTISDANNLVEDQQLQIRVDVDFPIDMPKEDPIANFTFTKSDTDQFTYEFDASTSIDADNDPLTYDWDFGDNSTGFSITTSHTYATDGVYVATLTVTDNQARTDTTTMLISFSEQFDGDSVAGETLYNTKCAKCHEGGDTDRFGEGNSTIEPININKFLNGSADLFSIIDNTMPHDDSTLCVDQCAANIEAFMLTWPYQSNEISCTIPDEELKFGSRQLKVLTINEYTNSVNDILGIDFDNSQISADNKIYEFSNQSKAAIDFSRFQGYQSSAISISKTLYDDNFSTLAGLENCVSLDNCAEKFISETLPRLFRRDISAAEKATYTGLFDVQFVTRGNQKEGLKLALRTALMSPNFLYRHEIGMTKAQYIAYNEQLPEPSPWVYDSYTGSDFKKNHIQGDALINGELPAYTAALIEHDFSDDDLIKINLLANQPVTVSIDGVMIWEGTTSQMTTIELNYNGEQGAQIIEVRSTASAITIGSLEIGPQIIIPTPLPVPDVADDVYVLTPAEMATYLAYSYTGTTPDDELLNAAINNELSTENQIRIQIERLLQTDAAKFHFGDFAAQWFDTDDVLYSRKDLTLFPTYTDEVKQSMAQEVREIFNDVMFDDSVPFSNLYDSNYTFLNQTLADFYGIDAVLGDGFEKTSAPERGGILTSGAFLSAWSGSTESKLVLRAVKIRERLMCQQFPSFPSDVDLGSIYDQQEALVQSIIEQENGLIRQPHLEFYNTNVDACQSCHEYTIDPLGLGLEDFDAVGLPRTQYANGLSVDFTGYDNSKDTHQSALYGITDMWDTDERIAFEGAKELGQIFGTGDASDVAQSCMVEMGFRFMTGKGTQEFDPDDNSLPLAYFEKVSNTCTAQSMQNAMSVTNNPKDAFIEMGVSDMVRYRKEFNQ